jgi:hypothetical protein
MTTENKNLSRRITFRLSPEEYLKLQELCRATTSKNLSTYIHDLVLKKPVYIKTRNLSLDNFVIEIGALRRDFKAVGFNFNQVVHKLHTLREIPEFGPWLLTNEIHKKEFFSKINAIQDRINIIYNLWLTDSRRPGAASEK